MAEVVSRAEILIEVKDQVARDLERVRGEVDRGLDKIEKEKATVEVKADTTPFEKDLKKAEIQLKAWGKKKESATLDVDVKKAAAKIREYEALAKSSQKKIDALNSPAAIAAREARMQGFENRRQTLLNKRVKAEETAAKKIATAENNVAKEIESAQNKATGIAEREAAKRIKIAEKEAADKERRIKQAIDGEGDLQRAYQQTVNQLNRMEAAERKLFQSSQDRELLGARRRQTEIKQRKIIADLAEAGIAPIAFKPSGNESGRGLFKLLSAITETTVRLGPFTASIGGAARVLAILGPMIFQIIGALGALTAAVGGATIGLVGLAGAGLTGFAFAAVGVGLTLKQLLGGFKDITTASKAYDKAVTLNGKNSKEAKEALSKLNKTMEGASPAAKEAFKSIGGIKQRWKELVTDKVRPAFLDTMGEGIKSLNTMMPMLARNTTTAFKAVAKGTQEWFKGLRSSQGQSVINQIFSGFNRTIPNLMHGFGSLAAAAGKLFASFSRASVLGRTISTFDNWATGLNRAANNTGKVNASVDKFMNSLRSVGRLLASTGRLLFNFINFGQGAGVTGIDRLTGTIDNLNAAMQADGGKQLDKFLRNAVDTSFELLGAIKPLLGTFLALSQAMAPITKQVAFFIRSIADLIGAVAGVPVLGTIFRDAFAVFLVGKLASSIFGVGAALKIVLTTMRALGATAVLGGLGKGLATGILGAGAGGGLVKGMTKIGAALGIVKAAAPAAAAGVTSVTAAAAGVEAAAIGAGTATGVAAAGFTAFGLTGAAAVAATGGLGLAAVAAGYGLYKLFTHVDDGTKKIKEYNKVAKEMTNEARRQGGIADNSLIAVGDDREQQKYANQQVKQQNSEVKRLKDHLAALRKLNKQGTQDYRDTKAELVEQVYARNQAIGQADLARQKQEKDQETFRNAQRARITASEKAVTAARKAAAEQQKKTDAEMSSNTAWGTNETKELDKQTEANKKLTQALYNLRRQRELANENDLNARRQKVGMVPLNKNDAGYFSGLNKVTGDKQASVAIAMKFPSPTEAGNAAKAARDAAQKGASKAVILKIIANAKNADIAVQRLRNYKLGSKNLDIIEKGGKGAIDILSKIAGRKLTKKEQEIAEKGGAKALAMIQKLSASDLKTLRQLLKGDDKDAKEKIRKLNAAKLKSLFQGITRRLTNPGFTGGPVGDVIQHVVRKTKGGLFAAGGFAFAAGGSGVSGSGDENAADKQAIRAADRRERTRGSNYAPSKGERAGSTRYVASESSHSEFIISTNPAYQKRNQKLVKQAASVVGVSAFAAGAPGYNSKNEYSENLGVPTNFSNKTKAYNKVTRTAAKKGKRLKKIPNNPYIHRLELLDTKQSDLERELSIRQSGIKEPDDYIDESTDPATGVTTYSFNQKAWDDYKAEITGKIQPVFQSLLKTVAEIQQVVPRAQEMNKSLLTLHGRNKGKLTGDLHREEKRKPKGAEDKKAHTARIAKLKKAIEKEKDSIGEIKESNPELAAKTKDAGFDYREIGQEYKDLLATISPEAEKGVKDEVAKDNTQEQQKSGNDTPSPGEQAFGFNQAISDLRQQYGGNTGAFDTSGGPGSAFGGLQQNAASLRDPASTSSGFNNFGQGAASAAYTGGVSASSAMGGTSSNSTGYGSAPRGSTGMAGSGGGDTTVSVVNNITTPAVDPHTISQGIAFELQAVI